ncbi:tyrosine-type recombinase/integrase [Desertibacillus haloalkaliphilus]|uniref:tyrosine-type recombinase/integrase n=1 Tax=Desertibacillus haloalkaliphilus TaxID=1328930 RepID=UPI001C25182E|nr:tyrosine-type recombinase/integrase [Desertibacillus haloalkaliphilus]MBU8907382.1 tyrosine-type recombinase/integrase [Desertibacillus haloalkaliphilus]
MDDLFENTLPQFALEYLESLQQKGRQPSTIKRYTYDLQDFFRWLYAEKNTTDFITWQSLTTVEIEQFLAILQYKRHYKSRTMKRIITVLKQLYRYHQRLGSCKVNPVECVITPGLNGTEMKSEDFISELEQKRLLRIMDSDDGLSENQQKARTYLTARNKSIIYLFLYYGLTLKETANLKMKDIYFERNELYIESTTGVSRMIAIAAGHKKLLYSYYVTIPEPVRPRYHSHDPFFVAFDFQRNTYRWMYEVDQPKALTEIAIQKMIREEIKRAGLRKGISAQHFRHTYALETLKANVDPEFVLKQLGLKTPIALQRYFDYIDKEQHLSKK